jgi:hypothetical protein
VRTAAAIWRSLDQGARLRRLRRDRAHRPAQRPLTPSRARDVRHAYGTVRQTAGTVDGSGR